MYRRVTGRIMISSPRSIKQILVPHLKAIFLTDPEGNDEMTFRGQIRSMHLNFSKSGCLYYNDFVRRCQKISLVDGRFLRLTPPSPSR